MVVVGNGGDAAGVVVMMVVVKNKKLCLLITCDVANTHKHYWTYPQVTVRVYLCCVVQTKRG